LGGNGSNASSNKLIVQRARCDPVGLLLLVVGTAFIMGWLIRYYLSWGCDDLVGAATPFLTNIRLSVPGTMGRGVLAERRGLFDLFGSSSTEKHNHWSVHVPLDEQFSMSPRCQRMLGSASYNAYMWNEARRELGLPPMTFGRQPVIHSAGVASKASIYGTTGVGIGALPPPSTDSAQQNSTGKLLRGPSSVELQSSYDSTQHRRLVDTAFQNNKYRLNNRKNALMESINSNKLKRQQKQNAMVKRPRNFTRIRTSSGSEVQRGALLASTALRTFYGVNLGCTSVPIFETEITYVTLWKCANDAVRLNLVAQAEREFQGEKFIKKNFVYTTFSRYQRMLRVSYGTTDLPPAFTFVREPISHFSSGITEYYWRAFHNDLINASRLRTDLLGFFEMTQLHDRPRVVNNRVVSSPASRTKSYELKHFAAMSGILKQRFNLKFVGKLENFTEDWERMNKFYDIHLEFDDTLGVHPTSKDPNGVKAAFGELFSTEKMFVRAFCQLLMVDYVCFNYGLPAECADITVNEAVLNAGSI
jgi:hypothetical protein